MPTTYWSTSEFEIGFVVGDQNANLLRSAIIDVDSDGDLDYVSTRFLFPAEDRGVPVVIMINDGTGGFTNATSSLFPGGAPTTVWPRDAIVADFNGDGRPDLYVADHGYDAQPFPGAQNRLILSSGASGFVDGSDRLPQVRDFTHSAAAADIDGDGDIDLLAMNIYGGTPPTGIATGPHFLINDGTGHFAASYDRLPTAVQDREFGNKYTAVHFFDADNDGDQDLLLGSHGETVQNVSLLLLNPGNGNFATAQSLVIPHGPFVKPGGVMDADSIDLNGDGALDLILTLQDDYEARYIQVLINNGSGQFTDDTAARLPQSNLTGLWAIGIYVVDFNIDGHMDLVAENGYQQPFLLNDGTGHFVPLPATFIDVEPFWNLQVFDANGDGRQDVLAMYGKFSGAEHYRLFKQLDGGLVQTGDAGDNALLGDADAETQAGLGGNDVLFGGAGNDTLDGGLGNDTLNGGAGIDTADLSAATSAIVFTLDAAGAGVVTAAGIDTDTLSGIEGLIAGSAADAVAGNSAANSIHGGGGNDTLIGGLGIDTVTGGVGEDVFQFAFADLQAGIIDRVTDYTPGTDAIKILSNVGGDTVATASGNAVVTFGNGYQMSLTGSAGQVIRLDFTNRWEYWDTGTNAAWSRYTDYLNAQGAISDQEIVNDNGTLTQRHVDLSPGGTLHAWIEYTDYYSAAPHTLTDQEIRYDNGTIGQRHLNQAGTLEYTDYVTPGAILLDQEVINLNGTREQRHYDPSNTRSTQWSSYTDYFNAANPAQITAKSMIYDPGAFTHGTFGAVHQTQWEYAVAGDASHGVARYYNAANVLLGQEFF